MQTSLVYSNMQRILECVHYGHNCFRPNLLTIGKVTEFFENATQIVMSHSTRIQLKSEGIKFPDDLFYFDANIISTISNNLR